MTKAAYNKTRQFIEPLEARHLLAFDSLVISEFMAKNDSTIQDDDGDYSDWIEVHNPTHESIDLTGWKLTDDSDNLAKWEFPAIPLAPNDHLVVFASSKDRRVAGEELHTNFKLSAAGEYLALVSPQGSKTTEWSPAYPEQTSDLSYGLFVDGFELIDDRTTHRFQVPRESDSDVGLDWTVVDFDDDAWDQTQGPLGFDVRVGIPNAGFEDGSLNHWESSGNVRVFNESFGVDPPQGSRFAIVSTENSRVSRAGIESFLSLEQSSLNNVVNGAAVSAASAMRRTITVPAGAVMTFDWNFLSNDEFERDFAFFTAGDGTVIKLADTNDPLSASSASGFSAESGFGTFRHVFPSAGTFTIGFGITNANNRNFDSALLLDNMQINGEGDTTSSYVDIIKSNTQGQMLGVNDSLWWRSEFEVSNDQSIESLLLNVQYDDGFQAYLNGVPLVANNSSGLPLQWNSSATGVHSNNLARDFETFSIGLDDQQIQVGTNVLAIQALNSESDPNDFLFDAELRGLAELSQTYSFLESPTPGHPNLAAPFGYTEDVVLDVNHGIFDTPFTLTMHSDSPDAVIRYTTNGSTPTPNTGMIYEDPLIIDGSTVIRAGAFDGVLVPRRTTTATYVFIDDVVNQTTNTAIADGFPRRWRGKTADYAMDRRVIGSSAFGGKYAATIRDDLLSLPSMSLVMDLDDLFGTEGFYSNPTRRGVQWERPVSVELFDHTGAEEGFQIDAGIRVQGGISREISNKLSMRLLFKTEYGDSKLRYPLFGSEGPRVFDGISLRGGSGEVFRRFHFIRDQFMRQSQIDTGNAGAYGRFVHLYINGLYWGVYNPSERVDEQFAINRLGGQKGEFDVYNAGDLGNERVTVAAGTMEAWNTLNELAGEVQRARTQTQKSTALLKLQGLRADGTNDPQQESYLDLNNFIDYLIVNVYGGNSDWPFRNYLMYRKRGPDSPGFQFQVWDAEFTLDAGLTDQQLVTIGPRGVLVFLPGLLTSDAFKVHFADRVQKHFSFGGALYVHPTRRSWDPEHPENNVPAARYNELVDAVRDAMVGESARWGDDIRHNIDVRFFTPDEDWEPVVTQNLNLFFPSRSARVISQFDRDGLYEAPPQFSLAPGRVLENANLVLSNRSGASIYYTTDGSDPRLPNGQISPNAVSYSNPIFIRELVTIQARSRANNGPWSAIDSSTYFVDERPANASSLRVTEINYNPFDPIPQLGEADVDADRFEFIELTNLADSAVDLSDVQLVEEFGQGISFTFGNQTLAAGESVVIPADREAFVSRYGRSVNFAVGTAPLSRDWHFMGNLSNGGDKVLIRDGRGNTIQSFRFDDSREWPERADGNGSTLEVLDPQADYDSPTNWRSSSEFGGSPGTEGLGPDNRVVFNEVLSNTDSPLFDSIELHNTTSSTIDLEHWFLSDSNDNYFKFQFDQGSSIDGRSYFTIDEQSVRFALNGVEGDDLFLIEADAEGRPLRFVDRAEFGPAANGVTLGRWPNGQGRFYPMREATLGAANTGPFVSDVVISEIQVSAAPLKPPGPTTEQLSFVEIANVTDEAKDISGWKLKGDIDFAFAEGTTLTAGSAISIVPFDPIEQAGIAGGFKLLYGVNAATVLMGPYTNTLSTSGNIRLERPLVDGIDSYFVIADEVRYESSAPWPTGTDGTDDTIHRIGANAFGSFGFHWQSQQATPGRASFMPDQLLGTSDVDAMCSSIHDETNILRFDLDGNGLVNPSDLQILLTSIVLTGPGDSNLDGVFDSADFVLVFVAGEYEDAIEENSRWSTGDWNCDGEFNTSDLVHAFRDGLYVIGGAAAVAVDAALHSESQEASPSPGPSTIDRDRTTHTGSNAKLLEHAVVDRIFDAHAQPFRQIHVKAEMTERTDIQN